MFPQDAAGHQDLDVNDDDDYNDKYVDNGDCNGDGEGGGDVDDFEGDHANDDHSNIVRMLGSQQDPQEFVSYKVPPSSSPSSPLSPSSTSPPSSSSRSTSSSSYHCRQHHRHFNIITN